MAGGPCAATTFTVVAHEDDDLLFVNPDLLADMRAGRCLVTVFMTAGDAGRAAAYWKGRETGARAAYRRMAAMAGREPGGWRNGTTTIAGRRIATSTLGAGWARLYFLRLPDGHGYANHDFETMRDLYRGLLPEIHAIDGTAAYTQTELLAAVRELVEAHQPDIIRTLDYTGEVGSHDHADHLTASYFTYAAHAGYRRDHEFVGYRGYILTELPRNLTDKEAADKTAVFMAYGPHDIKACPSTDNCPKRLYLPWMQRRHFSAPGRPPAMVDPATREPELID